MATPRLFKPFRHEPSKQVYLDGGLSGHNNPIAIADTEHRAICHGSSFSARYPDFILSLGTGLDNRPRLVKKNTHPRKRNNYSVRIRTKIIRDPATSAADSQRAWDEYISLVPAASRSAFIRVNPEMNEDLPEIDDFSCMNSLQAVVRTHLLKDNQIEQIAGRLIAALFYFELSDVSPSYSGVEHIAQGMLHLLTSGVSQ